MTDEQSKAPDEFYSSRLPWDTVCSQCGFTFAKHLGPEEPCPTWNETHGAPANIERVEMDIRNDIAAWKQRAEAAEATSASHCRVAMEMQRQRDAADAERASWVNLFGCIAKNLKCLPSMFGDGNEHVVAKAASVMAERDAARAAVVKLREVLADIRSHVAAETSALAAAIVVTIDAALTASPAAPKT